MTQAELRSFIDLCNVFLGSVLKFSKMAASLNKNLQKDLPAMIPFLTPDKAYAEKTLKRLLTNSRYYHSHVQPANTLSTQTRTTLKQDSYYGKNRRTSPPTQLDTGYARSPEPNRGWQLPTKNGWW